MYEADIRLYLAEIKRLLRVGGVAAATFFLLNDQRVEWLHARTTGLTMHHVLNAHTGYHNANDKLHAIAFDRDWVRQTIEGFTSKSSRRQQATGQVMLHPPIRIRWLCGNGGRNPS